MNKLSVVEIVRLISQRQRSAAEIVEEYLKRIKAEDGRINSFISVDEQGAVEAAHIIDKRLQSGEEVGPLAGVPLGIKDVLCTAEWPTTAGSKALQDWRPSFDATVVARLKQAGAIVLGKNNCDEFAMGSSTEFSAFGPTLNPVDVKLVPGGSSGGSAAAVAANFCPAALGTDTGGSVRQPAAFCGTVGFKPTYGRLSRYGLIAMASSLDTVGFLTNNITDAALLLSVTAGVDALDNTSVEQELPLLTDCLAPVDLSGITFGWVKECFLSQLEPNVAKALDAARQSLEQAGGRVVEISIPSLPKALAIYYILMPAEVSANLARFDGVRYGPDQQPAFTFMEQIKLWRQGHLGPEVQRRILMGAYVLSAGYQDAFYRTALKAQLNLKQEITQALNEVDFLITPTTPTSAFPIGSKIDDPLAMYLSDLFTVPANITGVPAISLPLPNVKLPVGWQLMSSPWQEAYLLSVSHYLEKLWSQ